MRILAVDQSFTSCGIVVVHDKQLIYGERLVSDCSKDTYERAWLITQHVSKLAHVYLPQLIAVEGLAFNKVGNATRDLAGLQYVLVTQLRFINNFPVAIISPNNVKKVATGKGNSKKQQLVEALPPDVREYFNKLNLKKTTGLCDLTDAYWIAITAEQNNC